MAEMIFRPAPFSRSLFRFPLSHSPFPSFPVSLFPAFPLDFLTYSVANSASFPALANWATASMKTYFV
jgi:hypothetical protein